MKTLTLLIAVVITSGVSADKDLDASLLLRFLEEISKREADKEFDCPAISRYDDGETNEYVDELPFEYDCGVNKYDIEQLLERILNKRVVGGRESKDGKWPWMVAIRQGSVRDINSLSQGCGGALVGDRWVITARHCFDEKVKPCQVWAQLGENGLWKNSDDLQLIQADRIIASPNTDLALVRLSERADLSSEDVNVVCLPYPGEQYDKNSCMTAGWGVNEAATLEQLADDVVNKLSSPENLQHLNVPVLDTAACQEKMGDAYSSDTICVAAVVGKNVCSGDSGGPLVCQNEEGVWLHIGVTEAVWHGCAKEKSYSTFVSVMENLKWIEDVIKRNGGA